VHIHSGEADVHHPHQPGPVAGAGPGHYVILDCRFQLTDPEYGLHAYRPAIFPVPSTSIWITTCRGENRQQWPSPLPDGQRLAVDLGAAGITGDVQVICYDDAGGMYAARAWMLLRWLGHAAVAVLDGGIQAWQQAGAVLETDKKRYMPRRFPVNASLVETVDADQVLANLDEQDFVVVDARSPERFRGEGETMDRWVATSPAHATASSSTTWMAMATSRTQPSCAVNGRQYWQAAAGRNRPPVRFWRHRLP
jgi:thiosulfate/3-mercaptopyruvate sulfurtransferase